MPGPCDNCGEWIDDDDYIIDEDGVLICTDCHNGMIEKSSMAEYVIVSTSEKDMLPGFLCFFSPNSAGYTCCLNQAGRYSESTVRELPEYYNNHKTTFAIPFEVAEALSTPMVISPTQSELENISMSNEVENE